MLSYAIKTGSVELIRIVNRLGHGKSYTLLEETETELCMQKLSTQDESVAISLEIKNGIPVTLGWDNVARLEVATAHHTGSMVW